MTDPAPALRIESREAIEIVTLDRAERLNVLDPQTVEALIRYFDALPQRVQIRVVILRSSGAHFCAGADLGSAAFADASSGRAHRQDHVQRRYARMIQLIRQCPQPVIALIQGAACGAGFSLALAADVRYATPDARMNAAYLRIGLGGCDMGSGYLLPRLVGLSVASELLLSGRYIDAARAQAVGLVSEVVAADQILDTALALAADMLRASPLGLRMTKESLNALVDAPSLDTALMIENRQQVMLTETADHQEAMAAFREKRAPHYQDR
ncbi:MAG TPA: enoyl-CoA hydratase/isomerase family protein [Fontimonas sp.]